MAILKVTMWYGGLKYNKKTKEFYAEEANVCVKNKLMFHIVTIITFCVEVVTEYEGKEFIWPNVFCDIINVTFVCEDQNLEEY